MNHGTTQVPGHTRSLSDEWSPRLLLSGKTCAHVCVSFTLCFIYHFAPCCFLQFPPLALHPPLFHSSKSIFTPQGSFLIIPPTSGASALQALQPILRDSPGSLSGPSGAPRSGGLRSGSERPQASHFASLGLSVLIWKTSLGVDDHCRQSLLRHSAATLHTGYCWHFINCEIDSERNHHDVLILVREKDCSKRSGGIDDDTSCRKRRQTQPRRPQSPCSHGRPLGKRGQKEKTDGTWPVQQEEETFIR